LLTNRFGSNSALGQSVRMEIRVATIEDAEATRQIYNNEVLTSTVTFDLEPRSLADQRRWLSARSGAHAVVVAATVGAAGERGITGFA